MRVSLRRPGQGAVPTVIECSWDQVVEFYVAAAKTPARERDPSGVGGDVPGIAFGAFDGSFKVEALRTEGLWAMVWDFDDVGQVEFERALAQIRAAFSRGLAHTTWSFGEAGVWTPARPVRARVVVPFDEPCPAHQWPHVWQVCAGFALAEGAAPDAQCKNVNRWYYLPVDRIDGLVPQWARPCWIETWPEPVEAYVASFHETKGWAF